MANAKKCDRCEKYYELPSFYIAGNLTPQGEEDINCIKFYAEKKNKNDKTYEVKTGDLCPDCTKSLIVWLKLGKK